MVDTHQHWLQYVCWEKLEPQIKKENGWHVYTGSAQYRRRGVSDGAVIWLVSWRPVFVVQPKAYGLILCGRLRTHQYTNRQEVIERTGLQDAWREHEDDEYLICKRGEEEPYAKIPMGEKVCCLRFDSGKDRLTMERHPGNQLQAIRRLMPESVNMLEGLWNAPRQ